MIGRVSLSLRLAAVDVFSRRCPTESVVLPSLFVQVGQSVSQSSKSVGGCRVCVLVSQGDTRYKRYECIIKQASKQTASGDGECSPIGTRTDSDDSFRGCVAEAAIVVIHCLICEAAL
eukprot:GHVU01082432.1.p1 GENE.GHVU01082432.1~~GHVU01082432.1.p1  ORF type:complete len:118 (+),score=6.88 GHVU01082432.1:67-420(+)